MASPVLLMEERTAALTAGAPAHVRPRAMASFLQPTVLPGAYDRGDVCVIADVNALHTSPAIKAWAVRPLIPDGGGGG